MSVDWNKIKNFKKSDFPEDPDQLAESDLIYTLQELREFLKSPIYPSPAKGALARLSGSIRSQHYAVNRKSTAIDVFIEGIPIDILVHILSFHKFNGIGFYPLTTGPNGKQWPMFHLDLRPVGFNERMPLIWIRDKVYDIPTKSITSNYFYPQRNIEKWNLFDDKKFYTHYKFRS